MRINLSARTSAFTVLGNEVLRDRRLSFTARGILAYLLSLPDGAREDVRSLADRNPGLGRRGVAKAIDELIELGYYVRRTLRDEDSGQVRTETCVFDTAQFTGPPHPVPAGSGDATAGKTGEFPKGNKNPDEEPTHPRTVAASAESPGERAEGAAPAEVIPASVPAPEPEARGAALVSRLGRVEPKLALSAADALVLAPLADKWLDHGVCELEARSLLTAGLPPVVHCPRAFLADRLARKLPPPRPRRDAAAPATTMVECADCRDPLPKGQQTGVCAVCAVCAGAVPVSEPAPAGVDVSDRVAALRAVLRARPAVLPNWS